MLWYLVDTTLPLGFSVSQQPFLHRWRAYISFLASMMRRKCRAFYFDRSNGPHVKSLFCFADDFTRELTVWVYERSAVRGANSVLPKRVYLANLFDLWRVAGGRRVVGEARGLTTFCRPPFPWTEEFVAGGAEKIPNSGTDRLIRELFHRLGKLTP